MRDDRYRPGSGFTLIEMLVVIAIIGLLASLIVPVVGKAQQKAMRVHTLNNLRQVGLAFRMYAVDNNGDMPIGYQWASPDTGKKAENWRDVLTLGGYVGKEDRPSNGSGSFAYEYSVMGSPLQRRNNRNMPKWDVATFSGNNNVLKLNQASDPSDNSQMMDRFQTPTQTMLLAEGSTHGNSNGRFNSLLYGHEDRLLPDFLTDEKVSALYLDGHTDTRPLESWPKFSDVNGRNEAWAFWIGM